MLLGISKCKKSAFYFEIRPPFIIFADRKNQTLVIMKKYIRPFAKSRKANMNPFAIEIHSDMGDKEQYSNTIEFEGEQQLPTPSKNIWGD